MDPALLLVQIGSATLHPRSLTLDVNSDSHRAVYAAGGESRSRPCTETLSLLDVTVTPVQPYQATKEYLCPGCEGSIPEGTFHLVVVPDDAPDLRRHWHHGCWHKELRRRFGAQASRR